MTSQISKELIDIELSVVLSCEQSNQRMQQSRSKSWQIAPVVDNSRYAGSAGLYYAAIAIKAEFAEKARPIPMLDAALVAVVQSRMLRQHLAVDEKSGQQHMPIASPGDDAAVADRDRKVGRTEVSTVAFCPEDLTPKQKLAVAAVGLLAIFVGVMGLLGFPIRFWDRE